MAAGRLRSPVLPGGVAASSAPMLHLNSRVGASDSQSGPSAQAAAGRVLSCEKALSQSVSVHYLSFNNAVAKFRGVWQ